MSEILIKLGLKLLTESFIARVVIYSSWEYAKRTKNTLDDNIVKAAADAEGIKLPD